MVMRLSLSKKFLNHQRIFSSVLVRWRWWLPQDGKLPEKWDGQETRPPIKTDS